MKKITLILMAALAVAVMMLTSCSKKDVTVIVVGPDGEEIVNTTVQVGAENPDSIQGTNYYALDCFEAALKQAGIEYYINKEDYEAFAITNVGDIACDKTHQFVYYRKEGKDKDFVNKMGLSAMHDMMDGGEIIKFVYEEIATETK